MAREGSEDGAGADFDEEARAGGVHGAELFDETDGLRELRGEGGAGVGGIDGGGRVAEDGERGRGEREIGEERGEGRAGVGDD